MKKILILFCLSLIISLSVNAQNIENSDTEEIKQVWNKVQILEKTKKFAEAEVELRSLVNKYPNRAGVWYVFGINLFHQKKSDEAVSAFKRVLEIEPEASGAMFYLGVTLTNQKKDYESAIPYLQKYVELSKLDFQKRNILDKLGNGNQHLADAYFGAKRFEEACIEYEKLVERSPAYFGYSYRLALCYLELNRLEESEKVSRKLLELNPNNYNVWRLLGNSLTEQNRINEADEAYQRAVILCPNCKFN